MVIAAYSERVARSVMDVQPIRDRLDNTFDVPKRKKNTTSYIVTLQINLDVFTLLLLALWS